MDIKIKIDKYEEDILEYLEKETGKSKADLIKMALGELQNKVLQDKITKATPIVEPIPPYPHNPPYNPPVNPVWPDTIPYWWYRGTTTGDSTKLMGSGNPGNESVVVNFEDIQTFVI